MMDDNKNSKDSSQPQPSNPQTTPQAGAAAGDPTTPPAVLTPEELAIELLARLDDFEAQIPNFQHHDKNDIRRVAGIARFAPELVVPTISTVTSYGPAAEKNVFNVEKNRLAIRRRDAFTPVIQRLAALTDGMQFTVNSDLAEAGSEALNVYAWAKSYAKRPDAAPLHPYVAKMSLVVKKVLNHRRPAASTPTPAPSGPTPSPTSAPSSQLPPGGHGFLASKVVPAPAEPVGDEEYPDYVNEALDRATKE
jgi:hypothetical protein